MMNDMTMTELVERKFAQIDADKAQKEADRQKKNKEYLESAEWKNLLEQARTQPLYSYTIIYRDTDDSLKEAWHHLADMNIEGVKQAYKEQKKDIIRFVPKELPFGAYLKTITGSSKGDMA